MRTTLRIEDDLIAEAKQRAAKDKVSLAEMINRLLRSALRQKATEESNRRRYREKPVAMGEPRADLTKALQRAATLEDDEIERNLSLRK
jgi:hypothetical protein